MKTTLITIISASFLMLFFASCNTSKNVASTSTNNFMTAISQQNFKFEAKFVQPNRGISKNLTPGYTLTVSKDSITSYLPFFGRAYNASYGASDGGIKFSTTNFTYKYSETKKGFINLNIKAKADNDTYDMYLTISPDGYGTLVVSSNNKETISYTGIIVNN